MNGVAYVFLNRRGANGLGHVGCAFLLSNGMLRCTATENQMGTPVTIAENKGFWTEDCANQLESVKQVFRKRRKITSPSGELLFSDPYTDWKRLDVNNVNPEQATAMMYKRSKENYIFSNRNCENDVYDILHDEGSGYGITANAFFNKVYIGWVQTQPTPNAWFALGIGESASGTL